MGDPLQAVPSFKASKSRLLRSSLFARLFVNHNPVYVMYRTWNQNSIGSLPDHFSAKWKVVWA